MESLSEEEDQFFDTREDITTISDSGSENLDLEINDSFSSAIGFEIWIRKPLSINERRNKFLNSLGLSVNGRVEDDHGDNEIDRMRDCSGTVLASSFVNEKFSNSQSSLTSDSRESMDRSMEDNFILRIKNIDDGTEFIVDELGQDGNFHKLRELGSNRLYTMEEFERNLGLSPLVQPSIQREIIQKMGRKSDSIRKSRGWLKKLGCISHKQMSSEHKVHMVKVHGDRNHVKEFSAVYNEQDLKGHDGRISTMKFSPDGLYLATAGEDGIIRVWQILERERSRDFEIKESDPSYIYFNVNDSLSEIAHLHSCKDKKVKSKNTKKMSYKCVIFPEKIFSIMEKPIHEFKGHSGEVLDLSWSKNKYILSSSVDKTVCLWQVGYDHCLKTFSHNDYVTSVEFNPIDDNYFISGSIDGKLRIWDVTRSQVVDWTDVHEIVTAVSYQPDGKGGVIGTISGNCRFYTASDNIVSLYAQVCFKRKKSTLNRITGFQFSPIDPSILMVTSADAQIRIIRGIDVIDKFGGSNSSGTGMSASFASDGKHIISVGDNSTVHLWNFDILNASFSGKRNNHSSECFMSENVSMALLWPNAANGNFSFPSIFASLCECSRSQKMPLSDSFTRCSATWPEEKLPSSKPVTSRVSQTSCEDVHGSWHSWGTVIVTAGSDGRIRSFQNFGFPVRV